MENFTRYFLLIFLFFSAIDTGAQTARESFKALEQQHKECEKFKADSVNCHRIYLQQLDSIMLIVFEKVKVNLPSEQKAKIIKEQLSWSAQKNSFFKKQDENFVYNLQEGIWTKDMIRITYATKSDFVRKRLLTLLKQVQE
ncbi:MAG: hypothetical protein IPM95_01835 [Sphingobacteriales bacterium]|nr:hypothetical protein [Sphingobacteriales bacterium]